MCNLPSYIVHAEVVQCHTNGTARTGARAFCVACRCRMCYADRVSPVHSWVTGNLTLPPARILVKPVMFFLFFFFGRFASSICCEFLKKGVSRLGFEIRVTVLQKSRTPKVQKSPNPKKGLSKILLTFSNVSVSQCLHVLLFECRHVFLS